MKIYAYILIVLSGVLTAQCSKVTLDEICGYPSAPGGGNGEGEGNGDYNSYWYYSYEAAQLIDAETLGMETAEDFTPYTVAHLGDTLFIANIGKAGSSLLLFSIKKGERLGTLQSWQHDGGEKSFGSQIEAIVPSGNRLYVAERQSRIHVFRLPELSYLFFFSAVSKGYTWIPLRSICQRNSPISQTCPFTSTCFSSTKRQIPISFVPSSAIMQRLSPSKRENRFVPSISRNWICFGSPCFCLRIRICSIC